MRKSLDGGLAVHHNEESARRAIPPVPGGPILAYRFGA